ncbi:hypothetical protein BU25DRAFT_414877 [Macroventuria anomochaeta]|uniref:Uncharacterized protein n=1 Tax=Macroventuria anomochaeta TaxID=301207 RepID=A0ACB6RM85_9PLEO|nr:uncharacterized protein BU25DRAFT_414877 [Macroventuria anomochaeta]KAF2622894.1 hypothetical protein BU25DRAFT_414877 [Macroventuria anomochaeta]
MAEVVGLAASIIQIGGAGTKLSIELYNFISTAARADSEITNIAGDVKLTSKVLGDVGKVLVSDDAKKLVNQDAIQHAKELIRQCEEVFNELSDVVEKGRKPGTDGKSRVSFRAKMGWPMKEQRVELLRRRLETLKSSLLVLFYVLQLAHDKARGYIHFQIDKVDFANITTATLKLPHWKNSESRFGNYISSNKTRSEFSKRSNEKYAWTRLLMVAHHKTLMHLCHQVRAA